MKLKNILIGVLFFNVTFFQFSCVKDDVLIVDGMTPTYIPATDFSYVKTEKPRGFENLGNIVNVGDFIFINELNKGIHVIDNSNPANPIKLYFWRIPGNIEFTIVGDILYADNGIHLLVINISDFSNIKVVNYIKDIYIDVPNREPRPPNYVGYFHCVDKSKGVHIGWRKAELIDPLCEAY